MMVSRLEIQRRICLFSPKYSISGLPDWLTANATAGSLAAGAQAAVTLTVNAHAKPAGTYMNSEDHVRYVLDFAARHGLHPDFAIYEPGFLRAGAALARAAGTKAPIYRLMFCNVIAVGFPPKPYALAAYLALLEEEAPGAPWMIAGVSADIRSLIGETVRRGGHIRVGLEDAPLGTKANNLKMVEEAVRMVRDHGGEPATPAEMRQALAAAV